MDAGIATEANLTWLRDNGFHYIVVHRGKSDFTPDVMDGMKIIRKEEEYTVEVCRKEKDGETLLLCRSTGRIEKDKGIRDRQEQLFVERLEYYRNGLSQKGHTKGYAKVLELVGRLREKYPKASKVYDVEVITDKQAAVKSLVAKDIKIGRAHV